MDNNGMNHNIGKNTQYPGGYMQDTNMQYQNGYMQDVNMQYQGGYMQNPQYQGDYMQTGVPRYQTITLSQRVLNPSTIVSLVAVLLLMIGLAVPIMDFTVFHKNLDIQYNFAKICENVGLLSPIWNGLTYGIIIGIAILIVLSFVNIPPLKIIPCVLILVMLIIALADVGNVVEWGNELIESTLGKDVIELNTGNIKKGIMSGAYFLGAGLAAAFVSCFIPGAKAKSE